MSNIKKFSTQEIKQIKKEENEELEVPLFTNKKNIKKKTKKKNFINKLFYNLMGKKSPKKSSNKKSPKKSSNKKSPKKSSNNKSPKKSVKKSSNKKSTKY